MPQTPLFPSAGSGTVSVVQPADPRPSTTGTTSTSTTTRADDNRPDAPDSDSDSHRVDLAPKKQSLDWLANPSFQSDNAFVINQQHLKRSLDDSEQDDSTPRSAHLQESVAQIKDTEYGQSKTAHQSHHSKHKTENGSHKQSHKSDRHHKKVKKKKRKKYDQSSSSEESDNGDTGRIPAQTHRLTTTGNDNYCIDTKANRNNLCFDMLHFTEITPYRRFGRTCLGLNRHQLVGWDDARRKKKQRDKWSSGRYFAVMATDVDGLDQLVQRTGPLCDGLSFIPIHPPPSERSDLDPLGICDSSAQTLLIGSNTITKRAANSKAVIPATKSIAKYNQHLHENPTDIEAWLEFVRYQDSVLYDQLQSEPETTDDNEGRNVVRKRTARMISDKKLAILDKALIKNPNSVPLQLEQLAVGEDLWEMTQLKKGWRNLVQLHPGNVSLWRQYLLFNQCCFSTFSVSTVSKLYGDCFKTLVARLDGADGSEAAEVENCLYDLFVSVCNFWRQSGHTERAVAAYQAVVELNCFCPPDFQQDTSLQEQLSFLETFWDSSEPRIGEKGAKGWATWMLRKQRGGWAPDKIQDTDESADDLSIASTQASTSLHQAWLREEIFREQHHFAPWRPNECKGETEEDCEDPERIVLFDDIGHVLVRFTSLRKRFQIVLRFLEFLGVGVPPCLVGSAGAGAGCPSLYFEQPSQVFSDITAEHAVSGVVGSCRALDEVNKRPTGDKMISCCDNKSLEDFVEEVCQQVMPTFHETVTATQLLTLRLDFRMSRARMAPDSKQLKKRVKEAKRFAKRLLSLEENRNNLDLWAALARWEHALGSPQEAKRVLQMALVCVGQPATDSDVQAATRVVQTHAELFFSFTPATNNDNIETLHALTTLAERTAFTSLNDTPVQCVSSVRLLKARRNYQEMMMSSLSNYERKDSGATEWLQPSGSYIVHLTKCFATFQYLTVGMQAASVVLDSSLSALKRASSSLASNHQLLIDRELLTTGYVRFMSAHVYTNPSPLGALRNLIKTSLEDFPSNPDLLEAFINSEARSHVAGRARRYFDRAMRQTDTPLTYLFAVRAELLRQASLPRQDQEGYVPETGISHRIRSVFDRAVESKSTRHCVLLWRMYMKFEIDQGNCKRAEAIYYNALQHCPWAKVLYMDAVRYFESKLQDCQDILIEKELRIRAPLEEMDLIIKSQENKL